ncbi:hypothetical protein [Vibrio cholerae]|uniref:hypothetical protein n=1 Tax=Vibrio cholerae TaxID=666 RepID=UPI000A8050BB|nr:hypothetical protein [Vibrio cholerae]
MFYLEFLNSVSLNFYILFASTFLLFSILVGVKVLLGPTLLSAISFLSSVSLALIYANPYDSFILLLSLFCFLLISYYFSRTITNFRCHANDIEEKIYSNLSLKKNRRDKTVVLFFCVLFLLVNTHIYMLFSESGRVNKLTWTVSAGALPYIYEALLMISICCFLHCLERRFFLFCFLIFILIGFSGLVFGSKGVLINIFIVYLLYRTRFNISYRFVILLAPLSIVFLFILSIVFFGSGVAGFLALFSRIMATLDGTFSIFFDGLYESFYLDKTVLIYYFDVFYSRFYGVQESLGQIIANHSRFYYPEFGGPNDSVVNYLLLSTGFNKLIAIATVCVLAFFSGFLDVYLRSRRANYISLKNKIAIYPLYFLLPALYQGVGTGILLFARVYVIIIPLYLCWFFIGKMYGKK